MNRNYHAYCAILLAIALILVMCSQLINSEKTALGEVDAEKSVYLTFDDGPSDRVTPKILDVLKEENVTATFFIVGQNAKLRKYLLEREFAEGHTVAVHSYTHDYKKIYA